MIEFWPVLHFRQCTRKPYPPPERRYGMPIDDNERQRRRKLLAAHYAVENHNDLDGIMGTFSAAGEMIYNGQSFPDAESIRQAHTYIGFSSASGAFSGLRTVRDREHFTADEI